MGTINEVKVLVNELLSTEFTIEAKGRTYTMSAKGIGYSFAFNNRKRAFGTCNYTRKLIGLSLPLCSENLDKVHTRIKNTILHELAHAFCVEVYGIVHGKGHGSNWKSIAIQIGNDGQRCFDSDSVNTPKSKYTIVCDNCGYSAPKHRKITRQYACAKCCNEHNGGKFTSAYLLKIVVNNLEISK